MNFSEISAYGRGPIGYCALEYKAHDDESAPTNLERIVLIADRCGSGELQIRVHPEWRKIVAVGDQPIVCELFEDFAERARLDSESLLKQLSSLSVGKLLTYDAGKNLSARPDLQELSSSFRLI